MYLSGPWSNVFVTMVNKYGGRAPWFLTRMSWASAWKPSSWKHIWEVGVAEVTSSGHSDLPMLGWVPQCRTLRQVLRTASKIPGQRCQWNSAWRFCLLSSMVGTTKSYLTAFKLI